MTARSSRNETSRLRLPLWGVGLLAVAILLFLAISAAWLFQTVRAATARWELTENPEFGVVSEPAPPGSGSADNPVVVSSDNGSPIISPDALKPWSGRERVSILLLGIDERCDEEGPTRTDTIMVLTMDPVGLSASMLSLPRDLWVEIPGFGVEKINQAYFLGEGYEYPGGGPALAVETVEGILGIHVDFYATANFDAFVQVIDQIGGIDVEVAEDIVDADYPDNCYGYDPFYVNAGQQHLDGHQALKYARTRATFGGDVDRADRQQQVVMAVRDRILRLDMVPQLLTQAPDMWRIFQDNVRTNMSLNAAIQLGLLAQEIPTASIRTEVLGFDYVYNEMTPDGQQVLVPVRENIRALRDQLFSPPAIPTPVFENLPLKVGDEDARVAVYNGTRVFGLAAATQEYLLEQGIDVVAIGNADSADYRTSQIIDYGSHPSTTLFLTQIMGIPPLNISSGTRPDGEFDVLIILGDDWRAPRSENDQVNENTTADENATTEN